MATTTTATEFLTEIWEPGQVLALNPSASLYKHTADLQSPSLFETARNLMSPEEMQDQKFILVLYLGMSNLVEWMSQVLREHVPVRGRRHSGKALPLAKVLINETLWFVDPVELTAKFPQK